MVQILESNRIRIDNKIVTKEDLIKFSKIVWDEYIKSLDSVDKDIIKCENELILIKKDFENLRVKDDELENRIFGLEQQIREFNARKLVHSIKFTINA